MKILNPTSAGRRGMTTVDYSSLSKKRRFKALSERLKKHAGRNNQGRITVRHQGGGNKNLYRIVDFKQNKIGIAGVVKSIEYDPYRTAFIALIAFKDGEYRYVLAPDGLKEGMAVMTSDEVPFELGMRTPLRRIPVGHFVHNVELTPGRGGQLARSAGSSVQVLAHENGYSDLKLPSGEVRRAPWGGLATIGKVSNPEHNLVNLGKAGRSRHLGIRPTVRGSAMNPVDHPYGGGEGRAPRGTKRPKTKWGKVTGGRKTRKKHRRSNALIIKRRK